MSCDKKNNNQGSFHGDLINLTDLRSIYHLSNEELQYVVMKRSDTDINLSGFPLPIEKMEIPTFPAQLQSKLRLRKCPTLKNMIVFVNCQPYTKDQVQIQMVLDETEKLPDSNAFSAQISNR